LRKYFILHDYFSLQFVYLSTNLSFCSIYCMINYSDSFPTLLMIPHFVPFILIILFLLEFLLIFRFLILFLIIPLQWSLILLLFLILILFLSVFGPLFLLNFFPLFWFLTLLLFLYPSTDLSFYSVPNHFMMPHILLSFLISYYFLLPTSSTNPKLYVLHSVPVPSEGANLIWGWTKLFFILK